MSKRTFFTTITPLPQGITRETVIDTLHSHVEMIDLNPLVIDRFPCKAPRNATAEEYHCIWYQLTDKVQYLPGGMASGKVSYTACFHDLANGLQTHVYAPLGLDIKGKWSLGGSLPGEPKEPVELGLNVPRDGLYLREDVEMRCNMMMTSFVKKTLKKAHSTLVDRIVEKSHIKERNATNERIAAVRASYASSSVSSPPYSPSYHQGTPSLTYSESLRAPSPHQQYSQYGGSPYSSPQPSPGFPPQPAIANSASPPHHIAELEYQARNAAYQAANHYPPDYKGAPPGSPAPAYYAYQTPPVLHQQHPAERQYNPYMPPPAPPVQRTTKPTMTNSRLPTEPVEMEG